MGNELEIVIKDEGRSGTITVKIGGKILEWYWELGSGKEIASINIPTVDEWEELFPKSNYDRNDVISKVANKICAEIFKDCRYKIDYKWIVIYKSN